LGKRLGAEATGTGLLLAAIVGSGIMADRLSGGNVGLALLANALATGGVLSALILAFGAVSGAHFNPAVTLADAAERGLPWRIVPAYIGAQVVGAVLGVVVANVMFEEPAIALSGHTRAGFGQLLGEGVATFGLLAVIWGGVRRRSESLPFAVGLYVAGAIWFTSSTAFANPAVTIARALTDTFTGIRLVDVPGFVAAQVAGALAATALFAWLMPAIKDSASNVVMPHAPEDQ
jgi:glycerol uptake facilitator-like aquaporin